MLQINRWRWIFGFSGVLILAWAAVAQLNSRNASTSPTPLMKPFVLNHRSIARSLADVSFLLDAPAGKDGFIRVRGSHFVKADGSRIRFWGVHLTDWSAGSVLFPPKEDAPIWAEALARHGINIVRLHFLDLMSPRGLIDSSRKDTLEFDPGQLDRLDFMISELKKRGIYLDLNLNVGRSYKAGDGVADAAKLGWGKGVVYYNPRLIELQKDYAKKLLDHVNPYTNLAAKDDPAFAIVEIVNENALYMGFKAPSESYEAELRSKYNRWLERTISPEVVRRLKLEAKVAPDGDLPRLSGPEIGQATSERFATETAFYSSVEQGYYKDMKSYLCGLGVKQPIIGTADHSHTGSSYSMLNNLQGMDIMDGHDYWQHPGSPEMNTAMVNDPFNSTVVELSRTAVQGKPYTVSETNHPFPNEYSSEGIPILAAYGCLQDWDMIIVYTFEPKLSPTWQPYVADPFDISHDPVRMTEMAAGALTFLRGDVKSAKRTIERSYTPAQVVESGRLPRSEKPYFTPGFPLALPLIHKVRIKSFKGPATSSFPKVEAGPIVSDTGELTWLISGKVGMVTVDTDRTQSIIGFINSHPAQLKNLSASVSNRFASIWLTSMDASPISRAENLLLTTGSKVENTGMIWGANHRGLVNQGGSPTLIETVTGTVTLLNLRGAKSVVAYPLDGAGGAMGAGVKAKKTDLGWEIPIGDPVTCWYKISVTR